MLIHKPVLVKELLEYIPIEKVRVMIDATVGLGGHAINFLRNSNLTLIGLDIDIDSLRLAEANLSDYRNRIKLMESNYKNIQDVVDLLHLKHIDFICADLGLSSYQLNCERRGFSFTVESILDMRYSKTNETTAKDLVNRLSKNELEWLFKKYGQEPKAKQIAEEIVKERKKREIVTTKQLADIIYRVKKVRNRKHDPATLVFQALRIAVNDELGNLSAFLKEAFKVLSINGYLAVISYHSLEDRLVKNIFKSYCQECRCRLDRCKCEGRPLAKMITPKAIKPTAEEIRNNRRARSAKLRIIKKIANVVYFEYITDNNSQVGTYLIK